MVTYKITGSGINDEAHDAGELSAKLWEHCLSNLDAAYIDDFIDEVFGSIEIGQGQYWASQILKECDPIHYAEIQDEEIENRIQDVLYDVGNGEPSWIFDITIEVIEDDSYNASYRKPRYRTRTG